MRYAAGCLCSALLASLFTFWLAEPPANRLAAQETGPVLPGAPADQPQAEPPALPPRRTPIPESGPGGLQTIKPRASQNTPQQISPRQVSPPPSSPRPESDLRPVPDPISEEDRPLGDPVPADDDPPREIVPREVPSRDVAPASDAVMSGAAIDAILGPDGLTPEEAINVAVYEKCNRGVVNITSKGLPGERFLFMEAPGGEGNGSGAVLDLEGRILTNYHVVENAQEVEVTLFDGSNHIAKFVGADPVNDIAVIKIDAPADKLFPIEIGDSSRMKVGMRVYAIGNPFGLERTMTTGIVSSLNRTLQVHNNRTIKAIIQIDAAVNPGNSGGPLLDSRGELIGVTTAIATRAGQSAGVAFAIPATLIDRVVPQLVQHGRVIRPEIGIQQVLETEEGLRIASLTPGGPAERAGLRGPSRTRRGPFVWEQLDRADLIVAVDGEEVKTADDFLGLVEARRPGDTIRLTVTRGTQTAEISVTLAAPSADPVPVVQPAVPPL